METYSKKDTSSFLSDLASGHEGEIVFYNLLKKVVPTFRTDGKKSDVEFLLDNTKLKAEVKFDKKSDKTGNIAVEYGNPKSGKDTGLLSSDSDLWAIVMTSGEVWVSPTAKFKLFFDKTPGRDMIGVGDGNSNCRLYKKEVLLGSIFTRVDNLCAYETRVLLFDMFVC